MNYYPKQYTYFDKVYPRTEIDEMGKRVREFCADHDGTLWIGTEDKGLFHYYPSTGLIEPFRHPDIYHNVHGLCLDGNYLWVGHFAKGLNRIDLRTHAVKHYFDALMISSLFAGLLQVIYGLEQQPDYSVIILKQTVLNVYLNLVGYLYIISRRINRESMAGNLHRWCI